MKKRPLTDEEKALWATLAEQVERLPPAVKRMPKVAPKRTLVHESVAPLASPRIAHKESHNATPITSSAGLDRNNAERLRKGKYPIDASLDLHGMKREAAQRAVASFITRQYAQGSRCVLIVTGKGLRTAPEDAHQSLKAMLPMWLESEALRPAIITITQALPKDGGSGAVYVLLRRKR